MLGPPAAAEVLHVLERVPADASGALVRERPDGTMAGALLVEHGRVCWAMSQRYRMRLTDILIAEQATLSAARLDEIVTMCHREHKPLGETLLALELISLPVLHRALLRHTCEALDCLVRDDASPWSWVAHSGYGYLPMLTFSAAEVLTGVRAIANPALAARALARLRDVVRDEQLGFAIERAPGATLPLAQLGCDRVELAQFAALAALADEIMAVAATVDLDAAISELDGFAYASWIEDNMLFVLLCHGELAFNRLLAQVAAMTTPTQESYGDRKRSTQ
jgi:hypothetical protein